MKFFLTLSILILFTLVSAFLPSCEKCVTCHLLVNGLEIDDEFCSKDKDERQAFVDNYMSLYSGNGQPPSCEQK